MQRGRDSGNGVPTHLNVIQQRTQSMNFIRRIQTRLAHRAADESGFTLIELLVVVAIIGILAAIGISTVLGRRVTAMDGGAKDLVATAQQTAINWSDSNTTGTLSPAVLNQLEPAINIDASHGKTVLAGATGSPLNYVLSVVSSSADTFVLTDTNGTVTRTCTVVAGNGNTSTNTGGGCKGGFW